MVCVQNKLVFYASHYYCVPHVEWTNTFYYTTKYMQLEHEA